ncbi:MAG: hypothetical protein IJ270_05495 [Paludibacteraceae bacterium]|nr:hypothetical protein [Paludibacteraceae bacterium]
MENSCENCKFRAYYDKKPKSVLGRFWRWHINFSPGWKAYFTSLPAEKQEELRDKYQFDKYQDNV